MSALLTRLMWAAIGGEAAAVDGVAFRGAGALVSAYAVTDFAAASIATAGLALAELLQLQGGPPATVSVDRRLSSLWFGSSLRPIGWGAPAPWDPIAGDYATRDGWIRLHTNAPRHRAAAERVLGAHGDRNAIARAVGRWTKSELERAVVEAGGCAAEMRSPAEWERHVQGRAVSAEPPAHVELTEAVPRPGWEVPATRPLAGLRVLDLTRVLAGPVATRFLAGYGADVLRIDPADWNEPGVVPDVTLGKRCALLDLRATADRAAFEALLSSADVLVHGYRPGALEGLGFGLAERRRLAPGLIDVGLDAYGWTGPWAGRRGFDSLVQMSSGIADAGMRWARAEKPVPLPVQALDHATGYLLAALAIRGVTRRLAAGTGTAARLSLARTAMLLPARASGDDEPAIVPNDEADVAPDVEITPWGTARRVRAPLVVGDAPLRWDSPACELRSASPAWRARRESNPHLRV